MAAHPSRRPFRPPQDEAVGDIGALKSSNRSRSFLSHDVKQACISLSSNSSLHAAAPCGVRVVPFFSKSAPKEGVAERRQAHSSLFCRACEARRPRERNAGRPVATGTPSRRSVVAVFGRGPVLPPPAVAPEPMSDLPASRPYGLMGGVPDLPRCGSRRSRGTPLPAPSSGSSPEDAPSSEDAIPVL